MMETDRLRLPLLAAGQAQKEVTHNEALMLLDIIAQSSVESLSITTPPAAPEAGQCWIVPPDATGVWAGWVGAIAAWTTGGWLFIRPGAGWRAWAGDRGHMIRFDGNLWVDEAVRADGVYLGGQRVIAARLGAIAAPSGGASRDEEARATLVAILEALRAHGLIEQSPS